MAWYRRAFQVPADWTDSALVLHFGAVGYYTQLWLNETFVGDHEGGYLPFEFEVSECLRADETNDLLVRVTAPSDDPAKYPQFPFAEIPHGKQSWYGPVGGIWQSVWLERRSPFHVQDVQLRPDLNAGRVEAHLKLSEPADASHLVVAKLVDPDGDHLTSVEAVVRQGIESVAFSITAGNPLPWSPERPHLYEVHVQVSRGSEIVDTKRERFGFRTIEARDGSLFLNGDPLYLRGVLDQGYYPGTIYTPPSEEFLRDQIRQAKELGFNCLRCHIKAADPRYYEIADRMGMLIWAELPNWHLFTERAAQRARDTLEGILERDGNHPSIIAWTIINEDWGTDLVHDPQHRAWLQETYRWLKELDPTRLIVDNSPCWPNFHIQTDVEDYHHYQAIPDHRCAWDDFVAAFADRADWAFSPDDDAVRIGDEPLVVSEFGNWGLPDVDILLNADGREPWWFEEGLEWGGGVAYPHGVRRRFKTWHLDRVFGTWSDFIEATQWQQFRALKYQIESLRRRSEIAGYVITELTDVFWECNGLLDMQRNPKVFCTDLVDLNADTLVIPEWERVAYRAGEPVQVGISVCYGAGAGIEGSKVHWTLPSSAAAGRATVPALRSGHVKTIGTASFAAPEVGTPLIQRLDLELRAADGFQLASNHLALTIFPERSGPVDADVLIWSPDQDLAEQLTALGYGLAPDPQTAGAVVARRVDEALISYVRQGGRLLLLAEGPDAFGPGFAGLQVKNREGAPWHGDWISSFAWLRREGPFARIPGGPLLDHSFDRVIPDCVLVGFQPWEFEAHVHAGLFVGWIHKPVALAAERRYGEGRAVITTFQLTRDAPGWDPMATTLLDAMIGLTLDK